MPLRRSQLWTRRSSSSRCRFSPDREAGHGYDVWVDAGTFVPVRKVMARTEGELFRVQEDYEYLPRSAAVLAELELEVPADYRRVPVPR